MAPPDCLFIRIWTFLCCSTSWHIQQTWSQKYSPNFLIQQTPVSEKFGKFIIIHHRTVPVNINSSGINDKMATWFEWWSIRGTNFTASRFMTETETKSLQPGFKVEGKQFPIWIVWHAFLSHPPKLCYPQRKMSNLKLENIRCVTRRSRNQFLPDLEIYSSVF